MFNAFTYLYVEDDPLSCQVMTMIMRNAMGIERLQIFKSSEDFSQKIMSLKPVPDIVLLDIHVRPHNGFEMLKMLRAEPSYDKVRIVALTASVMNEEVEQLRSAGFDAIIGKPLSVQIFPGLIKQVIEKQPVWHIP